MPGKGPAPFTRPPFLKDPTTPKDRLGVGGPARHALRDVMNGTTGIAMPNGAIDLAPAKEVQGHEIDPDWKPGMPLKTKKRRA